MFEDRFWDKLTLAVLLVILLISSGSSSVGDQNDPAESCKQISDVRSGATSGLYWIDPDGNGKFQVYCDMDYDGGGWTLLMALDDDDNTFTYDSGYWENETPLNQDDRNPFDDGFGSDVDGPRKYESFHRLAGDDLRIEFGNPSENIEYQGDLGGVTALDKFSDSQDLTLGTDDASGSCDSNAYGVVNHNSYDSSNMALGLSIAGSGINIESNANQRNDKTRFGIMSEEDEYDGYSLPRYLIGGSGSSVDWAVSSEDNSCGNTGTITDENPDTSAALWIREDNTYQTTAEVTQRSSQVIDLDKDGEFVMGRPVETEFNYTMNPNAIQVAFAVDETYSMGPVMEGVKDNIKWFFNELDGSAEGTVVGSGAGDDSNHRDPYHFTDDPYPSSALPEPRDLTSTEGLTSDTGELEDAAGRLRERTYFEGPDSTVGEAVGYGAEASDYTGNKGYYGDEDYDWGDDSSKAVIWLQDGRSGFGSCSGISDFSTGGLGQYMKDNGFKFYAIARDLGGCSDDFDTAASETGGKVYHLSENPTNEDWKDILGEISGSIESEVNLTVALDSQTYSEDDFDSHSTSDGNNIYTFSDINSTRGQHSIRLKWWPVDHGNMDIKTGESYLEVDGPGGSKKYDFTDSRQEEVSYVDLNISQTDIKRVDDTISLNLTLQNQGNIETKERYLEIRDEDGNFINRTISPMPAGSSRIEAFDVGANNHVFQDTDRITAYFDYRGIFNDFPMGEGQILEPDESDNEMLMGYPPRLLSVSPDEVEWNETFGFSMNFDHYFPAQVQGNYTAVENGSVLHDSRSFNKPAEGTVKTNLIDNNDSRIFYNFSGRLVGPEGAVSIYNDRDYYISNPLPEIYGAEPRNMEQVPEEVQLRAYVRDDNSMENPENLSVKLYNQETGAKMYEEDGLSEGDPIIYDWTTADQKGKTYRWNLTVSDEWDTISQVFRFQKTSRQSYRTETESEYDYSAVVTSSGSPGDFQYTVNNPLDFDKNDMETSLSGLQATFRDGSTTKSYSLPQDSSKTFDIIVKPDSSTEGQQELVVQTVNNELNTTNTERVPVYVRKDSKRTYEAPGIALYQMVFIYLIALFYTRKFNLN